MTDVMPTVREATREIREASAAGLSAVRATLDSINTNRWSRKGDADTDKKVEVLADNLHRLRQALAAFKETKRLELLQPYQSLLNSTKGYANGASPPPPLRTLFISLVFGANMVALAEGIVLMMEFTLNTSSQRRKNRIWAPNSIIAIFAALATRGQTDDQGAGEDEIPDRPETEINLRAYSEYNSIVSCCFLLIRICYCRIGP